MTLNEITYEIKMLLNKNRLTDDSRFDGRLIEKMVVTQRALWIKNQLTKNPRPPHVVVQDLGCVDVTTADPAECCDITLDCHVLRTTLAIPQTIEVGGFDGIVRVGPVDKFQTNYLYVDNNRARWAGGGYFNSGAIVATRLNGYMYLLSKSPSDYFKYLAYVNVRGVFEDPRDAGVFAMCSGDACWSPETEYPVPEALWAYMKTQIIEGNFGLLTNALSDTKQDADDEKQK